jgi:hypothetical protein
MECRVQLNVAVIYSAKTPIGRVAGQVAGGFVFKKCPFHAGLGVLGRVGHLPKFYTGSRSPGGGDERWGQNREEFVAPTTLPKVPKVPKYACKRNNLKGGLVRLDGLRPASPSLDDSVDCGGVFRRLIPDVKGGVFPSQALPLSLASLGMLSGPSNVPEIGLLGPTLGPTIDDRAANALLHGHFRGVWDRFSHSVHTPDGPFRGAPAAPDFAARRPWLAGGLTTFFGFEGGGGNSGRLGDPYRVIRYRAASGKFRTAPRSSDEREENDGLFWPPNRT